jgi:hypothetical protein
MCSVGFARETQLTKEHIMNIFDSTSTLSSEIVLSLFPDEERPKRGYELGLDYNDPKYTAADRAYNDWVPSVAAKAETVYDASDLNVGEVVIFVDDTNGSGVPDRTTIRKALGNRTYQANRRLHVVVSKTAKTAKVRGLGFGFWDYDLATLDYDEHEWAVSTITGSTVTRTVIRTGYTKDTLFAAVKAHPDYDKWQDMRRMCVKAQAKFVAKREREEKAEEARIAPLKNKVETLNQALNVPVASAKTWGDEKVEIDNERWDAARNVRLLIPLALAGRLHLGQITQEQYDSAMAVYSEMGS